MGFYLIAFGVVIIDQLIKFFVHKFMFLGQSIPLLNGVLKLTYVRNTGAAFSLFKGFSPYLVIISIIVILAVIIFHYKISPKRVLMQTGLAFVLGGSFGNLIDRLVRSYVIDYIDVTVWPVFNFADIMINIGVILIAFRLFVEEGKYVSDPV